MSEILENIQNKLQIILNKKFSNDSFIKRKIDKYHDRWNFCCPYCSDSRTNNRKKRGNLYLDNLRYFCFNCGYSTGINKLLYDFGEDLSLQDKYKVREIQQNATKFEKKTHSGQSSIAFQLLDMVAIPKKIFFKVNKLITPYKNEFCSNYLKLRKIDITKWKYFAFNENTKELFILNINSQDRIIGYQIRQLNDKSKKSRYLTCSLSKMYRDIFGKDINGILNKLLQKIKYGDKYLIEEDGIENISANLDRLSGLFNIMNVDVSKTLTIVEGPIDSLAIENCIALQGATKMNNYFDNVANVRYLFDNDNVGKKQALKKLKEHKKVFLWDMYLKELNIKCKIKDVNDLQKSDNYSLDYFNKCFSDNELDVIMI